MKLQNVAVLGAGNMGSAIATGILNAAIVPPHQLTVSDLRSELLEPFGEKGCPVTSDAAQAAQTADVWILAVKPQGMETLFEAVRPFSAGRLVISIAAGVSVATLEASLPGAAVVRVMPNTPMMIGKGVSAMCCGTGVSPEEKEFAERLFSCAGSTFWCDEALLNPMTALTSSSVAYFARLIADMCAWAKNNGFLEYDDATVTRLVCETAIGSAGLILERQMDPNALVRAVASPNGTTERALAVFDGRDLDGTISTAMDACLRRADELSGH